MDNKEIRKKAEQFRRKFSLGEVDYKSIKKALEKSGYSLIEFNNVFNDKNVASLINALNLTEFVQTTKCFTYADNNYRLIFVHEDLSESEKVLVLSHEAAHVALGHMATRPIIGTAIREEYEANEFTHYLLNRSKGQRLSKWLRNHKITVAAIAAIIIAAVVALCIFLCPEDTSDKTDAVDKESIREENESLDENEELYADSESDEDTKDPQSVEYYKDYYITPTGTKYHKVECKRIKDKENKYRMTVDDYESGKYEPCNICLPEE